MKTLNVTICSCQTCATRSARLFKELGSALYAPLFRDVVLSGAPCNGFCAAQGGPLAPCARVGGELITGASAGDVLAAIRRQRKARLVA